MLIFKFNNLKRFYRLKNKFTLSSFSTMDSSQEKGTIGGGCFWCLEAVFQRLQGVSGVESGYAGGTTTNPSYEEVCSGKTGHAEVVQVTFDPKILPYDELLKVFFLTHDPTTLNRQGNDAGTQYRSIILYHNETQKQIAEKVKKEIDDMKHYKNPIVTEIVPLKNYFKAESDHQDFYNRNPNHSYCNYVVQSKVDKFLKLFKDKSKPSI